ncbi:MAG TPA: DNA methyltransferase [Allosphingosinicella sp.]|jgi:DNA modification methylase
MTRVEQIGDCTLYLGDCRSIIPELEFDSVITDPPYGIEALVGGYGRDGRTIANDTNLDACAEALGLCGAHITCGWIAAFYSCRVSDLFFETLRGRGLTYVGEIIWDKKAPGMGGPIRYQHENVALFSVGKPEPLGACFSVIQDYRSADVHPHQKPLGIMGRLCEIVGTGTVLDPFMGSGTTGVAAVKEGRPFIGIEIDETHFETACRRIRDAVAQPRFDVAPRRVEQSSLLGALG